MEKKLVCIKIGGAAATDKNSLMNFRGDLAVLRDRCRLIVVHGGGSEVSRISRELGYTPEFRDGVRITGRGEMDVVEMVLSGKMNKSLVRFLNAGDLSAVGLCGSDGALMTGQPLGSGTRTGKVTDVKPDLLFALMEAGHIPVLSSTSMDAAGEALNINADEAALAVAAAADADNLIFVSDIPGILKDNAVLPSLSEKDMLSEIGNGTITGGMIPKVRSSLAGLKHGIGAVTIGECRNQGDLLRLVDGELGTSLHL